MIGRLWLRQDCVQATKGRGVASGRAAVQIHPAKAVRNPDGGALSQNKFSEKGLRYKNAGSRQEQFYIDSFVRERLSWLRCAEVERSGNCCLSTPNKTFRHTANR